VILNYSAFLRGNEEVEKAALQKIYKARSDLPVIYSAGCDTWYKSSDVRPCYIGKPDSVRTVVLLGDSIMGQWFSMLPEIFPISTWRIIVLTKSSCPMVAHDFFYTRIGKVYEVCNVWRSNALKEISKLRPDVVFMGGSSTNGFSKDEWISGTKEILNSLSQVSGKVLIVPGTPSLSFDGPACLARQIERFGGLNDNDACRAPNRLELSRRVTGYLQTVAKIYGNVDVLNLNELVCPNATCSAEMPKGQIVFRDSQHLTDSFVRSLVPDIKIKLQLLSVKFDEGKGS